MKLKKDERGAAGLEFTLLFPFLLFLCFLIVEAGAVGFNQAIITNAAREGARAAIVYAHDDSNNDPTCGDFENLRWNARERVRRYLQYYQTDVWFPINEESLRQIDPDDIPVSIQNDSGEYTVSVRVPYDHHFIFIHHIMNIFQVSEGNSWRLWAVAVMRGESNYRPAGGTSMPLIQYLYGLGCS